MQVNYDFHDNLTPEKVDVRARNLPRGQGKRREANARRSSHIPMKSKSSPAASARAQPTSTSTSNSTATRPCSKAIAEGPEWIINDHEGLRPARSRRSRLPHRHEVVVCSQAVARSPSTSWSTVTSPSPAPARTTSSSCTIPHAVIEGTMIAGLAIGAKIGLHLSARRVPLPPQDRREGRRRGLRKGLPRQEHLRHRRRLRRRSRRPAPEPTRSAKSPP